MKVLLSRPMHVAIIILTLALAGCLGGQSPSTNFYMLSALSPSPAGTAPASGAARIHIGLETVVIAEYLNRNEIVINLDNTIYQLAEFNQWAEPLSDNLTRVLEENLTNLLQKDSIEVFQASEARFRSTTGWRSMRCAWTAIWGIRSPWLLNGRFWKLRKTI